MKCIQKDRCNPFATAATQPHHPADSGVVQGHGTLSEPYIVVTFLEESTHNNSRCITRTQRAGLGWCVQLSISFRKLQHFFVAIPPARQPNGEMDLRRRICRWEWDVTKE